MLLVLCKLVLLFEGQIYNVILCFFLVYTCNGNECLFPTFTSMLLILCELVLLFEGLICYVILYSIGLYTCIAPLLEMNVFNLHSRTAGSM